MMSADQPGLSCNFSLTRQSNGLLVQILRKFLNSHSKRHALNLASSLANNKQILGHCSNQQAHPDNSRQPSHLGFADGLIEA